MNIITGKHIPRRTFIRGMGAAVALPFLDAMVPAGRLRAFADKVDRPRLVAIEQVHGAAGSTRFGATQHLWAPEGVGRDFDLHTGNALKPLEEFRDHLTIVSNTDVRMAEAYRPAEIGGDHFRSSAVYLTQSHPRQTEGSDVYVGTSLDQMYAQRYGREFPIPSMQLCIENIDQSGGCAYGYTCVYTDSISWASPTQPLPVIRDPRVVFQMLFGEGATPEERLARSRADGSVLDWITRSIAQMKRELAAPDQHRLEEYFESVREVERRIQQVEARNLSGEARELPEAPPGVPDSFAEHVKLMFDLQLLAFESDLTRVFSFKMGRDVSGRTYPESGSDRPFHPASHHGDNEERILDFNLINTYHVSMLPYFLEKLSKSMEGEASMLDKTMILYGSAMGDPNTHNHRRVPFLVMGGANGKLQGNQHIKAPDGTPLANAMLNILHMLGLEDVQSFGDSTGELVLTGGNFAAQ
jgi:hypothetical protein